MEDEGDRMTIYGYIDETSKRKGTCDRAVRHVTEALGGTVVSKRDVRGGGDAIVVWGWKPNRPETKRAIQDGIPVIVLENVLWNRTNDWETFTVGWNGLNGGAWIPEPAAKTRYYPEPKPWRNGSSGRITIFKQTPGDQSLRGADMDAWARRASLELEYLYPGREIVIREHPAMIPSWEGPPPESLEECFQRTDFAVTFSSTTGGECILQGIPTYAEHYGSLAWDVSSHFLNEEPYYPNRRDWLQEMSYRHWSVFEDFDAGWFMRGYDKALKQARSKDYDKLTKEPEVRTSVVHSER